MPSRLTLTSYLLLAVFSTVASAASNVAASHSKSPAFETGNVIAANETVFCELTRKGKLVQTFDRPKDLQDDILVDFQVSTSGKLYALFRSPEGHFSIAVYAPEEKGWDIPEAFKFPFQEKPLLTSGFGNGFGLGKLVLFDGKLLAVMGFGNSWIFDLDSGQARAFPSSHLARQEAQDTLTFWELERPDFADRKIFRRVIDLNDGSIKKKDLAPFLPDGFPNKNGSLTRLYTALSSNGVTFENVTLAKISKDGKVEKELQLVDLVEIPKDPQRPNKKTSPIYDDLDLSADDMSVICCSNGKSLVFVGPDLSKSSVRVVKVEREYKSVRWIPEMTNE